MSTNDYNGLQAFSRLLAIAGQKKWLLALSSIFAVLSEILGLVPFFIIYLITIKLLSPPVEWAYVWALSWAALGAVIGRYVLLYVSGLLSHIAAFNILYGLRLNLSRHLGSLPMGYFTSRMTGSIKKVMGEDVERIELFVAHHVPDLISCIALPVATLAFLFIMDWRLALAALVPVPVAILLMSAMYSESYNDLTLKYHDSLERMDGAIVEYVRGMPVIKIFNQAAGSFKKFRGSVYDYSDFCVRWAKTYNVPWSLFNVILGSSLLFILPVGIWLYAGGTLGLSTLLLFLILGVGYTRPLYKLVMITSVLQQIGEGVKRIDQVFSEPSLSGPAAPKIPGRYSIEFRDVSFSYDDREVVSGVSFTAREGTVTALVGPSGAGKSTIARLIPRLWDVREGEILVGGINVKDIPTDVLMDKISFVFQDPFIFSDTVYENIRMGKDVGENEVVAAAKAAQVHDVVMGLTDGYHTMIGEGGARLSGGEQQRVSLARAIVKNSPVVILDEATAFADAENEVKIQDALSVLMRDKTVIVIAHRLSTVIDSDQIVVIDGGRIVGKGRHEELLGAQSLYRKMWESHMVAREWTI